MKKPIKPPDVRSTPDPSMDPKAQTELFAKAMKAFQSCDYRKAKGLFELVAAGPVLSVNESALMYARMCESRIGAERTEPKTAEELYNFGVGLMNDKRYGEAIGFLARSIAVEETPHALYAHTLAAGYSGDFDAASRSLRRALELDPSTRTLARNDADFHPLLQNPVIRETLTAERADSSH